MRITGEAPGLQSGTIILIDRVSGSKLALPIASLMKHGLPVYSTQSRNQRMLQALAPCLEPVVRIASLPELRTPRAARDAPLLKLYGQFLQ